MSDQEIEKRVNDIAEYVVSTGATVRAAARWFGVSKSTVHKDLTGRLRYVSPELFREVSAVLAKNRAERHIRGGLATQLKYKKRRNLSKQKS